MSEPLLYSGVEQSYQSGTREAISVEEQVDRVQIILSRRNGESDTFYQNRGFDQTTEDWVLGFQDFNGLLVDGIVGPETRSALNYAEFLLWLKELKVQKPNQYGQVNMGAGISTEQVVREFQTRFNENNTLTIENGDVNALVVDGILGPNTLGALRKEVERLLPGLVIGSTQSQPSPPVVPSPTTTPPAAELRGSRGPDVELEYISGSVKVVVEGTDSSQSSPVLKLSNIVDVAQYNADRGTFKVLAKETTNLLIDFGSGNQVEIVDYYDASGNLNNPRKIDKVELADGTEITLPDLGQGIVDGTSDPKDNVFNYGSETNLVIKNAKPAHTVNLTNITEADFNNLKAQTTPTLINKDGQNLKLDFGDGLALVVEGFFANTDAADLTPATTTVGNFKFKDATAEISSADFVGATVTPSPSPQTAVNELKVTRGTNAVADYTGGEKVLIVEGDPAAPSPALQLSNITDLATYNSTRGEFVINVIGNKDLEIQFSSTDKLTIKDYYDGAVTLTPVSPAIIGDVKLSDGTTGTIQEFGAGIVDLSSTANVTVQYSGDSQLSLSNIASTNTVQLTSYADIDALIADADLTVTKENTDLVLTRTAGPVMKMSGVFANDTADDYSQSANIPGNVTFGDAGENPKTFQEFIGALNGAGKLGNPQA